MTDVPGRPESPQFVSPGPGAGSAPGYGAGVPGAAPAAGPAPWADDDVAYGARWGAPGGPTSAEQAAARRRARIWVASVLGVIVALVAVVAGVSWWSSQAREQAWQPVPADVTGPVDAHAVQLVLGSCLAQVPEGERVGTVEVVPCTDEHGGQVVARYDASADEVWPGADVVAARTARTCTPDLLGPDARDADVAADLEWVVWTPSEESWAAGDRTGLCVAAVTPPRSGSLLE